MASRAGYAHGALPSVSVGHLPTFAEFVSGGARAPLDTGEYDWSREVAGYPDLGNKRVGCCAVAGAFHAVQTIGTIYGVETCGTEAECLSELTALNGYNPQAELVNGVNPTDTGVELINVINRWMTTGLVINGVVDRLTAAVRLDPKDRKTMALAALEGFGVYNAYSLPISAQDAPAFIGATYYPLVGIDVPGSWARHCMFSPFVGPGMGKVATWGEVVMADKKWTADYCDECYLLIHPKQFALATGKTLFGLSLDDLENLGDEIRDNIAT